MPNIELIQRMPEPAPASSTLFGNSPYQTYAPSQGSVYLYKDSSCNLALTDSATPLLVGQCLNSPISGIKGASIASLPSCSDYGSPLLIVSNVPNCKNSTAGSSADNGVGGTCNSFSSGVEIGSMELICFGDGISSVTNPTLSKTAAANSAAYTTPPATTGSQGSSNTNTEDSGEDRGCCGSGDGCCCCCCTVM
jgi:hypothetical protein